MRGHRLACHGHSRCSPDPDDPLSCPGKFRVGAHGIFSILGSRGALHGHVSAGRGVRGWAFWRSGAHALSVLPPKAFASMSRYHRGGVRSCTVHLLPLLWCSCASMGWLSCGVSDEAVGNTITTGDRGNRGAVCLGQFLDSERPSRIIPPVAL